MGNLYSDKNIRIGLRIRGHRVNREIREAVKRFAKWLRKEYEFPIRVTIYLSPNKKVKSRDGDLCYSIFYEPYKKDVEPYINIATGYYKELKREKGRDNALTPILKSIALQLQYYYQWVNNTKGGRERAKGNRMLDRYAEVVEHP